MNGTGNDFIVLNNLELRLEPSLFPKLARIACRRRLSLGADGLMVVDRPEQGGDCRLMFYNSDGSMGEMCGNGARCICRYCYETGLAGEVQTIETTAGIITGWRIDRRQYRIRLNDPTVVKLDCPVCVDGRHYPCSYVELGYPGLPHAVIPMEHLSDIPDQELLTLGRKLRYHPDFPKGANVNFYEITGPSQLYERTYERGVEDFTYACGTGTGSVAVVLTLSGQMSGQNICAVTSGGELIADVEHQGDQIQNLYLTGPTNIVAKGELTDEELTL